MIRGLTALLYTIIFLIIGIPVLGFESLLGLFSKKAVDQSSLRYVQWGLRTVGKICGTNIKVNGLENVPKDQPVLYIANHQSIFDVILTYPFCIGPTGYIAKDSLKKVPLLSTWMNRVYCLFLNREDPRQGLQTILTAIDYIKNGISVWIFPEGTRNKDKANQKILPMKAGSFKIATKTNCPIIPVAITNSSDIFEDHFPFVKATDVVISYGKPIYPKELSPEDKKQIATYVSGIMCDMLDENEAIFESIQK